MSSPGSSPLTRGKHHGAQRAVHPPGLIPAHAGKTGVPTPHAGQATAHPRSRGENGCVGDEGAGVAGSSPLTRGKHAVGAEPVGVVGLIPAHAGKTDNGRVGHDWPPAHPRSRGENEEGSARCERSGGSSPLTRGKPAHRGPLSPQRRLIPAHAGKTPIVLHGHRA